MPATHVVPVITDTRVYTVNKNGIEKSATIMHRRPGEVYVHYVDTDKRMDEWLSEEFCTMHEMPLPPPPPPPPAPEKKKKRGGKLPRNRPSEPTNPEASSSNTASVPPPDLGEPMQEDGEGAQAPAEVVLTEEEFDLRHHQQLHSQKNFDIVIFDAWKIKPWYFSPYPLSEAEAEDLLASASNQPSTKIPGVARTTGRSHGRTSDLLAGGLLRQHPGESVLWVCHFCFKYMADGVPWELHKKDCKVKHPPGRKVYQRGAHTIWEVDGAKEKLYCQNLALFGKLFIDVKTLFFDCDNFLFYILTDAKSSEDHIMGFFSKEKLSYDDYNLACIMTLPQYQRKGYGMLLIEFSYELSRRAGKVGTPERPLSDLGLRSYLAYWISTLVRFLRRVLSVLPPDVVSIRNTNVFPEIREDSSVSGEVERMHNKKKKKPKGFDGEVTETNIEQKMCMMPMKAIQEPLFTTQRVYETTPRLDGGSESHVKVECSLADIARATNLRPDDAAFALNECGLLTRRRSVAHTTTPTPNGIGNGNGNGNGSNSNGGGEDEDEGEYTIVVTREMVERIVKERNIKIMYLDLSCVLLP
ncbi:hypothetical protein GALMADRAFT_256551 [Galerina marginata CBS 339.88]|uniref:histone acetyltransferase n=1 Tax=Galerina marginata (strain CBS 339.88) TaxID=685588 RepID=A0A067SLY3_GALM3|nr:hypothetical protein GALMADRAFT_256551 [Galerina marginata CBS 339.88]